MRYVSANAVGYGLFFALNMTAMWLGTMPFVAAEIQTSETATAFFMGGLSFELGFFGLAGLAAFRPAFVNRFAFWITALPWLFGMAVLSGISIASSEALIAWAVCGLFLGWGTAGCFLAWQKAFFVEGPSVGAQENMVGTLIAGGVYIVLSYLQPSMATSLIVLACSCVSAAFLWRSLKALSCAKAQDSQSRFDGKIEDCLPKVASTAVRGQGQDVRMFTGQRESAFTASPHLLACKRYIHDYWRSAVCLGVLGFCCGAIRCLATTSVETAKMVNAVSMLALIAAMLAFFAIWRKRSITLNTSNIFRLIAPVMLAMLLLIPVLGQRFVTLLSGMFFALLGCVVMLASAQCLTASAERKLDPMFTYGFFAGVLWVIYDIGHRFSQVGLDAPWLQDSPLACTSLLCACVIGLGLFLGQGGSKAIVSPQLIRVENIELMRTAGSPRLRNRETGSSIHEDDRVSRRMSELATRYFLTAREAEIAELVARGMTVKQIAQKLSISENTVRTHTKAAYVKLDVHKKAALMELVASDDE